MRSSGWGFVALAWMLGAAGCSDTELAPQKPSFDWGYPGWSEYDAAGDHVGETLYQLDPACQERLSFYECAIVNALVEDTPANNPTGASSELNGGIDVCTDVIETQEPSYCMPADVCNPTQQRAAWAPGQASTDNLAWQLFFAVNWPADPSQPGYPDPSRKPGARDDALAFDHAETVWLDYPTADQLFGVPLPCDGPTLTTTTKTSHAFLRRPPAGLGDSDEPTGGVLVDQDGGVVLYDIRVNRTLWEFIVNQNDYWRTGSSLAALKQNVRRDYQAPPGETAGSFPAAQGAPLDELGIEGSLEIKAAWKVLTAEEAVSGRFYTRTFAIYDSNGVPEEQCGTQAMGLIGIHLVYMPAQFGNPEWVWATFEHVSNVPTARINDGADRFNLFDPGCTPVLTPEECADYEEGVSSAEEYRCCPNLMLYARSSDLPPTLVSNQATRNVDPTVSTILPTKCTDFYQGAISNFFGDDSVWKNYFLVSTQWPLRGASTNFPFYEPEFEANFPCTLRNSTMETFLVADQAPTSNGCTVSGNTEKNFCRACNGDCVRTEAGSQVPCPGADDARDQSTTASCMNCHGQFAPQNSSFVFGHRPCCVRSDGQMPNHCGLVLDQSACEGSADCTWVTTDPSCTSS